MRPLVERRRETGHDGSARQEGARDAADGASLGQLIPWPDGEHFPDIAPEDALELFLGWVEAQGITLWEHQEEALLTLAAGDSLILGTPTGSGKSLVALGLCFMACCTQLLVRC